MAEVTIFFYLCYPFAHEDEIVAVEIESFVKILYAAIIGNTRRGIDAVLQVCRVAQTDPAVAKMGTRPSQRKLTPCTGCGRYLRTELKPGRSARFHMLPFSRRLAGVVNTAALTENHEGYPHAHSGCGR